jgi:enamine deaminase RidA (YjgF/YER057c/UK114 family)
MAVTLKNPEGLPQSQSYRQLSIATGSTLVFVAGQVAYDANGQTIGVNDLAAQVEQCYLNIATALGAAKCSFDDVVKITIFVVDWTPNKMTSLVEGIERAATKLGVDLVAPGTLVGVAALAEPHLLVEVEATAVAD